MLPLIVRDVHANSMPDLANTQAAFVPPHRGGINGETSLALSNNLADFLLAHL
jgi:hypothetical protein